MMKIKIIALSFFLLMLLLSAVACGKEIIIPDSDNTGTVPGISGGTLQDTPSTVTETTTEAPDVTASDTREKPVTETTDPTSSPAFSETPASSETPALSETPSPSVTPTAENEPYVLSKTEDGGLNYQNKIIFLGDSTSYGLKPYGMLPDGKETKQVWQGNAGATIALFNVRTEKITAVGFAEPLTIAEALEKYKPEIIVLKLGINGIASLDKEGFKYYYGWVIDLVFEKSPDTKLICQSIYPVTAQKSASSAITNTKIQEANTWIKQLVAEKYAKEYRCYYLDTYPLLLDGNGALDLKYENGGDGIHLNADGFRIVLNDIRTHMVPD